MGQTNSAQLYATIEPVTRDIWTSTQDSIPSQYDKIFDVQTTDKPIHEHVEWGGVGQLTQKTENAPVRVQSVTVGNPKRVEARTFATALQISFEALEDTRIADIKTAAKALGRATKLTPEYLAAQFLDRAFSTSYPVTADGQPLCSASHTLPNGRTFSNVPSVVASLCEASLEDMRTATRQFIGSDGMLERTKIRGLVVPSALVNLGQKLARSEKTLGSANNDPSIVQEVAKNLLPFDFLSSSTAYFGLTEIDDGLFFYFRKRPEFIKDNSPSVLTATLLAYFRCLLGCKNARSIYGVNAS